MAKRGRPKKEKEVVDLSDKEIKEIVNSIGRLEEDKEEIQFEIKSKKEQLEAAGFTKKQINEAIRLSRMEDDDRNEMLQGADKILTAAGRMSIEV